MPTLEIATQTDIPSLTKLAIAAFREDDLHKPVGVPKGGPPGHDSELKHSEWRTTFTYYKCIQYNNIIGSLIIEIEGRKAKIHGIQVHPEYMKQGIGSWILTKCLSLHETVDIWELETPDYSKRNHRFYENNGFKRYDTIDFDPEIGFGFIIYRKSPN